ncbi:MAG TPA: hypothetical protein VMZ06_03075 [Candidatus Bathyarchaeia archaeon]|nr:hypothetical protein [Candidatus Bathyarchaeia archaeon]
MFHSDDEIVTFGLTADEQRLILEKAIAVDPYLRGKLRLGVRREKHVEFTLPSDEFEDLLDALASEVNHASPRQVRRQFSRLYDRLNRLAGPPLPSLDQVAEAFSPFLPPELCEGINHLLQTPTKKGPEAIAAELDKLVEKSAHMPRPEFNNLSIDQVSRLIDSDWKSPDSVIQLNEELPLADLDKAVFFNNTRLLLSAVADEGRVKSTDAGNFNRKFVAHILDILRLPQIYVDVILPHYSAINETNVWPLHVLRVVAVQAGLLKLQKGYYQVAAKGKKLLKEPKAGELFVLLFRTYLRKFELSYLDRMVELPEVQDTLVYALYVISLHTHDWQDFKEFSKRLFLPAVADQIPIAHYGISYAELMASSRILGPLEGFGLIERQYEDKGAYSESKTIRKTALFDRFISFHL